MAASPLEVVVIRVQAPVITVVICAYNSRGRIGKALASLRAQDLDEPFEVIAVVSGDDGCAAFLARDHPDVRVVESRKRLYPGAARNAGIDAAQAPIIAFLPDEGRATGEWLRSRLDQHRAGFEIVAGAISNATPKSIIGTASYYVEYAASMPIENLLKQQPVPHTLSYHHSVFTRLGRFPELAVPGEDTVFNAQCAAAGLRITYEPRACIGHLNLTRLMPFLAHQRRHGHGLARGVVEDGLKSPFVLRRAGWRMAIAVFVQYPTWRWLKTIGLLARWAPGHATVFLLLTPVVMAGYVAGLWVSGRRSHRPISAETSSRPKTCERP